MAKTYKGFTCQSCGVEAPLRQVSFHQNIGVVVMRYHRTIQGRLCKRCVHKHFWKTTLTTTAVGWLGTISIILAPCFIVNNIIHYLTCVAMPSVPPGARAPQLDDQSIAKIRAGWPRIVERLNNSEDPFIVAADMAPTLGVTPGQIILFLRTAGPAKTAAVAAPAVAQGFPVIPVAPAAPLPPSLPPIAPEASDSPPLLDV